MPSAMLLVPDAVLAGPARTSLRAGWAVVVADGKIAALGPLAVMEREQPEATRLDLLGCLLMPGLINAHQHGRGLSQLQLGFPDAPLERWINARRRRGAPDGAAFTRLAAAAMLENGVTSAVHANYAYGTGDYEAEARAQLEAYIEVGLRVTFCVGAQDRGFVVYPPFALDDLGELPGVATDFATTAASPYAPDIPAQLALMDRLLHDWGDHPLVTLCWGPAGPQWVSDALLRAIVGHARTHGLGLHLHCLESPAQAACCRRLYPAGTLRHLADLGVLEPTTVLAHAVHLSAEDIAVAADRGVVVAHNPGCNLRLCNGSAPIASFLAAGVAVALGTDNCALADDEDLLGELKLMAGLARAPGPTAAPLDAETLLAAVTTTGARAMQQPDRLGRIAPGLAADLVAVDLAFVQGAYLDPGMDPLAAFAARARGRDVRLTMVGGHVLHQGGRLAHLDRAAVEAEARAVALSGRRSTNPEAAAIAQALDTALARLYGDLLSSVSLEERHP